MGTKRQLLDWARAQLGTQGGSKYWQQVYGWSGAGYAWCAVFCSAALKATGTKCDYFPSTFAFDKADISKYGIKSWVDKYSLKEGDMLAFDWDGDGIGDHVGIVEKVLGNGVYQTIEGNVSNSCGIRYRRVSDGIIGGIRPYYDEEEIMPFKDVTKQTAHFEDIKWMKEQGIAEGYADGTYRPSKALTRADAAAFLHRLYKLLKK